MSTVYDRPGRSSSRRSAAKRAFPAIASSTIASRCSPAVIARSGLCGGIPAGTNSTRSSPSVSAASSATARCAMWIGSNVPPKMPSRTASRALPGLRLPFELGAADPDGVARVPRPPGAARCRCRSARGRAGTARPIPRRRSSSGRRSARSARRGRGTPRRRRARRRSRRPSCRCGGRRRPPARAARRGRPRRAGGPRVRVRNASRPSPAAAEMATASTPSAARARRKAGQASAAAGRSILLNATSIGLSRSAGSCARSSSRMTS